MRIILYPNFIYILSLIIILIARYTNNKNLSFINFPILYIQLIIIYYNSDYNITHYNTIV